jgi:serine/threonine protein kinase
MRYAGGKSHPLFIGFWWRSMIGSKLGTWIIDQELGHGGMGRVYLAHEDGGRQAAVKVLSAALAQDPGFHRRFQQEIDILRKLDHPNIVHFYDAGVQDGHYFYAMEYIDGPDLEELLHEQIRLPWQDVLDVALQTSRALKHAHDRGIIHRDIKTSNLLVAAPPPPGPPLPVVGEGGARQTAASSSLPPLPSVGEGGRGGEGLGTVKLTDFGIAKVFAGAHLTATNSVVGTAEYLSPEQAAGKPVSKRSDLYSLGVVLYTLLTGRPPFQGKEIFDLLHKHQFAQFDRPGLLVPETPYELDEVVCKLLEKDPARRPPDAGILHRDLDRIRRKLERKSHLTAEYVASDQTTAENAALEDPGPGPATLMSQLVRRELEEQNRGGPVARLFNRPWVVALLLLACVGVIVWTFWPVSSESLFQTAAKSMQSDDPAEWEKAEPYLETLKERTDHPHREEVLAFLQQIDAARAQRKAGKSGAAGSLSEAQWFYQEGLRLRQQGQEEAARKLWRNLAQAFREVPAEQHWVALAEQELKKASDRAPTGEGRWTAVREALKRARELRDQDRLKEAEAIWQGLEELYRHDAAAAGVLEELRKDRGR